MSVLTLLFNFIMAIPILDRWFQAISLAYRDYRFKLDEAAARAAIAKTESDSTEDLQRLLGKDL